MFGVEYRYAGESTYRNLDHDFDSYAEAEMSADRISLLVSVEEAVVTESDPFAVESWNER
jgi:hypothetical protein